MGNIKKRIEILNDMYKDKVDVFIFGPGNKWYGHQGAIFTIEGLIKNKVMLKLVGSKRPPSSRKQYGKQNLRNEFKCPNCRR